MSWKRIKPLMKHENYENADNSVKCGTLEVKGLTFAYPGGPDIFEDVTFEAEKGNIIGVTGSVACGKSTLGKVFLCEYPYEGSIKVEGNELAELDDTKKAGLVGYLGHDPELFNDTVKNNIQLGDNADTTKFLKAVCFDEEVMRWKTDRRLWLVIQVSDCQADRHRDLHLPEHSAIRSR